MDYSFLIVIALIMLSTKVLGIASEKVNMPQVVGALIAGLLLGPSCFGLIGESDFLVKTAEIGVIILMFMAGLDTDLEELKHTGLSALVIATIGVIVPFLGGAGCYLLFNGEPDSLKMIKAAFIGVVLTATSVSITVETLREMGKLPLILPPQLVKSLRLAGVADIGVACRVFIGNILNLLRGKSNIYRVRHVILIYYVC